MRQRETIPTIIGLLIALCSLQSADAVSPASVQQGRELFEREWQPKNPRLGSDGLGPLFNAKSCVGCHHQGGIGGSGDARFNAHAIGIEKIEFYGADSRGAMLDGQKRNLIRAFFPGLVQANGVIVNSAPLPHHGGSIRFANVRARVLKDMQPHRSEQGGAIDAEAALMTATQSIHYNSSELGPASLYVSITARVFQRNSTALFGAGLIDQITADDIRSQAKIQRRHPEISGRVSLLTDGTVGRFGWRANAQHLIHFVEGACANELSLETKSRQQATDPGRPEYRNPSADISDKQVEWMTEYVRSLTRPIEFADSGSASSNAANSGKRIFESVGCAVCHVPSLGPASGIYSDILLHDMGPNLYDYDAAEPYVARFHLTSQIEEVPETRRTSYYGVASSITRSGQTGLPRSFQSQRGRSAGTDFVRLRSESLGRKVIQNSATARVTAELAESVGFKRTIKASNTTQEWRTPPLWGVADSAPYLHDGRAATLLEAITMHDGEAAGTRDRFLVLPLADRQALIAFLETLVAPPAEIPQS